MIDIGSDNFFCDLIEEINDHTGMLMDDSSGYASQIKKLSINNSQSLEARIVLSIELLRDLDYKLQTIYINTMDQAIKLLNLR